MPAGRDTGGVNIGPIVGPKRLENRFADLYPLPSAWVNSRIDRDRRVLFLQIILRQQQRQRRAIISVVVDSVEQCAANHLIRLVGVHVHKTDLRGIEGLIKEGRRHHFVFLRPGDQVRHDDRGQVVSHDRFKAAPILLHRLRRLFFFVNRNVAEDVDANRGRFAIHHPLEQLSHRAIG
jgi:hypothetical protein